MIFPYTETVIQLVYTAIESIDGLVKASVELRKQ